MRNLNFAEQGVLLRLHGIEVEEQVAGVAHCVNSKGERVQFAIEHLRSVLAHRPLRERIVNWLAGVAS